MVSIGEHWPSAVAYPIDATGHRDLEVVHLARQRLAAVGFADNVDVVAPDRRIDDPRLFARQMFDHHAAHDLERIAAAQAANIIEDAQRDVSGRVARELRSTNVGDTLAWPAGLAPGACSTPTALRKLDLDLHVPLARHRHGVSVVIDDLDGKYDSAGNVANDLEHVRRRGQGRPVTRVHNRAGLRLHVPIIDDD